MKRFVIFAAVSVMLCTLAAWRYVHTSDTVSPQPITASSIDSADDRDVKFLEMCSGLSLDPKSHSSDSETIGLIAVANCLGRIRGYVDGHQLTITMQVRAGKSTMTPLWCVNPSVTDKELMDSIFSWSEAHSDEFDQITTQYNGSTASVGIMLRAISTQYPCKTV